MKRRVVAIVVALGSTLALPALGQIVPPRDGGEYPQAYYDRISQDPEAFRFQRAWIDKARRAKEARIRFLASRRAAGLATGPSLSDLTESLRRSIAVADTIRVPVIAVQYTNTPAPFTTTQLQQQLLTGPTTSDGTITALYTEMSYGNVYLTGDVMGWVALSQTDTYYEGGCNGLCLTTARTGALIKEGLDATDPGVDFGLYDNDGPDGFPNSGDDDGFVDVVAFIHPESGGECGTGNMWSHRWVVTGWPQFDVPYVTNDARTGGGSIQILDYTMMPSVGSSDSGCGSGIVEIGVVAHEFGHVFGLPDLYDIDGGGQGIGHHGLMGSGNWRLPTNPTHMCAWSKMELGWLLPTSVGPLAQVTSINSVGTNPEAHRLDVIEEKFGRQGENPILDLYSLRCGLTAGQALTRNWPGGKGYGNGWHEVVRHDFSYDGSGSVTLSYLASYDLEPEYDFGRVKIDVGGTVTMLAEYNGTGFVPETIDLTPHLSAAGATDYQILFEFESDFAFSDEDGDFNSGDQGPFKIDNILLTGGGESYSTGFEENESGWYYDFDEYSIPEFFLVENRNRAGITFDQHTYAEGLYVWHIEQYVAHTVLGNTGGTSGTASLRPAGVEMEQADGLNQLRKSGGGNRGDAGDVYPGSTNNRTFTNTSNPNSRSHNNAPTNALVDNISSPGTTMTATMRAGLFTPTASSITPSQGEENTIVAVSDLSGTGFFPGATFMLRSGGTSSLMDYPASAVEWVGKTKLAGEFDFAGVPSGVYDVVVRNPDGQEATISGGFEVKSSSPVLISSFAAAVADSGVRLEWVIVAEVPILGFQILRREGDAGPEVVVSGPSPLEPGVRDFLDTTVEAGGTYDYVLAVLLSDGGEIRSPAARAAVPGYVLTLHQNVPNPFNPSTRISFVLPARQHIRLDVFDVTGRHVATILNEEMDAGPGETDWDGTRSGGGRVSSGVYFYQLKAGEKTLTRKLMMLK